MKAFFWRIIQILGKTPIFKNFAKPIPKPTLSISYQSLETVEEPMQIEEFSTPEKSAVSEDVVQTETATVTTLPKVIYLYDIQNTPVAEAPKIEEKPVSVPIRAIESTNNSPTNHKPIRKARKTVVRARAAKSIDGIKKISKSKPRARKKAVPIPPEATGFGYQKPDNKKAE